MTPTQFCYWLQGLFELSETNKLTEKQVRMIKEHLQLVFTKVTSDGNQETPQDQIKKILDELHKKPERVDPWPAPYPSPYPFTPSPVWPYDKPTIIC